MPATPSGAARVRIIRAIIGTSLALTLPLIPAARAATVSITLRWTAPGDNGNVGQAASYELRWSPTPINNVNVLQSARILGLRPPSPAGQRDSMSVTVPVTGAPLYFALRTADATGNWSLVSNNATLPGTTAEMPDSLGRIALARPVPNPARQATTISFTSPRDADARIEVYDTTGRRVRVLVDGRLLRGRHSLRWDLRDEQRGAVPAGVYLVRAQVGGWEGRQRIAVVR